MKCEGDADLERGVMEFQVDLGVAGRTEDLLRMGMNE